MSSRPHPVWEAEPTLDQEFRAWKAQIDEAFAQGQRLATSVDKKIREMERANSIPLEVVSERERLDPGSSPEAALLVLKAYASRMCTEAAKQIVAWQARGGGAPTPLEAIDFSLSFIGEHGQTFTVTVLEFSATMEKLLWRCVAVDDSRAMRMTHEELLDMIAHALAVEIPTPRGSR